ncbi:putative membrane protein YphA (DoxX/SURF4 family) [Nocardia kruczakiae]|uniref:Membrane protein YphA (DoxX/SURF4 family) n=1 Tax=Nocardia kruczakiae TaxID=261477 RepID=A0ABU1XNI0_9NOCA|nr:DoxX family protein [Nocardia kruczakiae]MDR7172118.1 putative membrane protein YphA (DoxX/SURF4 family) [Nocardia kruczakiae]
MRSLSRSQPVRTATSTGPTGRFRSEPAPAAFTGRYRTLAYRVATTAIVAEAGVGGVWDLARIPFVTDVVTHLGYPRYFLVLLGVWKIPAAIVLAAPRLPLCKEWAYAGTFFVYTGAIASHLVTGYARAEVAVLSAMTVLTVTSWALRPADRCLPGRQPLRMRS